MRDPHGVEDPHRWLTEIIEEEAPKVKDLIPKGAKEYYILTNVSGTGHPGAGSIDRVKQILEQHVDIPSDCWWRDDLDRRLENAWDLKWSYPELMTGPDLIRSVIESGLSEHKERRAAAVRAFVTAQYGVDEDVRFKQVELQNKLLELFIDVPISHRRGEPKSVHIHRFIAQEVARQPGAPVEDAPRRPTAYPYRGVNYQREAPPLGASTFLLHGLVQANVPRMVLEGAPGQGKSTIVQYVCQVHRMRLLGKDAELGLVPPHHKGAPIRIPIKVDLRDFAAWLIRKDPFSPVDSDVQPSLWHRSLESFLAFLIRHFSGGAAFEVEDLVAVAKLSSLLLVFDGLDEVAEISRRREVVDEISKGIKRISSNCASLQVVVTSRPAAFANSPGFPEEEFPHYQLEPVTRELIGEYAEKWLRGRRVIDREAAEVKKILEEKLGEPHIRELAKNPMQLAILLSLIHTRGASLPDKRTALYDSYIDLFFSREAAKSLIVRDHRDLLIDIHRYLAWVLHSEAEQGKERGSISSDRLQGLLTDYLCGEGQDPSLGTKLFAGMVERVVAVVSREGTYEFEVQPLREYFAARYLYDTAPYSPPGNEKRGTKPDRFDAIARNFYWLNVARFYAGCFSKGELASLVDRLQELIAEKGFANTSHPRSLAITLLSDWVFTQHPKSVREVLDLALHDGGFRLLLAASSALHRSSSGIALPKKCGGDVLVDRCFEILRGSPPGDYAMRVAETARANARPDELKRFWLDEIPRRWDRSAADWLWLGDILGILRDITAEEINQSFSGRTLDRRFLITLMYASRADFVEAEEARCAVIAASALDGHYSRAPGGESVLDDFAALLDPHRYARAFQVSAPVPLADVWKGDGSLAFPERQRLPEAAQHPTVQRCLSTVAASNSGGLRLATEWATQLAPWNDLVEKLPKHVGRSPVTVFPGQCGGRDQVVRRKSHGLLGPSRRITASLQAMQVRSTESRLCRLVAKTSFRIQSTRRRVARHPDSFDLGESEYAGSFVRVVAANPRQHDPRGLAPPLSVPARIPGLAPWPDSACFICGRVFA